MFIKELIRFSTQLRCYCILMVWIFLLIAGMYKYIGNLNHINYVGNSNYKQGSAPESNEEENHKFRKYKERCSPIESLTRKEDGGMLDGWKLQGALVVIRHGDRGPMSHVRGISAIDCGVDNDPVMMRYKNFLLNATNPSGANHMYWNKLGPFHGFALLPSTQKACLLGQLTFKGISQHLHIGELLYQIYAHPLGLLSKQASKLYINSTPHSQLNSDEVVVYTTRYRRTFQSAMALLYNFLPTEKWLALNILESHSMAFCFSDCACPQAETLRKKLTWLSANQLAQHPAVSGVIQWIGLTLLQNAPSGVNDPKEVMDAVLTVLCHDAPLPCRKVVSKDTVAKSTTVSTTIDLSDVINIDQDDDVQAVMAPDDDVVAAVNNKPTATVVDGGAPTTAEGCIEPSHVSALMSYSNWQSSKEIAHAHYKRIGLLRAYGMIRNIVSYMLKMISGDRTKFVLYSGHDWTLQYLTAALGIYTETAFIPYAARMSFEVYKSETNTDFYFRVLYNGKDVTKEIDFCEGGKSLQVSRDNRGNKADLCPMENIIRFLHEDFFAPLNATNFKDACTSNVH